MGSSDAFGASMSANHGPLGLCIIAQIVDVVGNLIGQRAARADFGHSTRRMTLAIALVSCVQVTVILGAIQLAAPTLTSDVYHDSQVTTCTKEVDLEGQPPDMCSNSTNAAVGGHGSSSCHAVDCPSQGPWSLPRSISLHPILLLNGFQSVAYYVGESLLYTHPLGTLLIVIAGLTSAAVITPMEMLLGLQSGHGVNPLILLTGILGSALCVAESDASAMFGSGQTGPEDEQSQNNGDHESGVLSSLPKRAQPGRFQVWWHHMMEKCGCDNNGCSASCQNWFPGVRMAADHWALMASSGRREEDWSFSATTSTDLVTPKPSWLGQSDENNQVVGSHKASTDDSDQTPDNLGSTAVNRLCTACCGGMQFFCRVILPFLVLTALYGSWFVSQRFFNDECRLNVWGYPSLDQCLCIFYIGAFWASIHACRVCFQSASNPNDGYTVASSDQHAVGSEAQAGTNSSSSDRSKAGSLDAPLLQQESRAQVTSDSQSGLVALFSATWADLSRNRFRGMATVFIYRLLLNGRAMVYFYLAVNYDLASVYLTLQLCRVAMTWFFVVITCAVAPSFLSLAPAEAVQTFYSMNLFSKVLGTALIFAVIVWMHATSTQ